MLRLRALIVARTEGVDDVPVEEPRELVKADDAGLLARVCEQIARARLRPTGHDRDGGFGRVVAVFHAGGARLFAVIHLLRHGLVDRHLAQRIAQDVNTDYKPFVRKMIETALDKLAILE